MKGGGWEYIFVSSDKMKEQKIQKQRDKPKRSSVLRRKKPKMTGRGKDRDREENISKQESRFMFLTNVLETNGTRGIVKVYTADVQGVQLRYVMPSYLHTGQHSSAYVCNRSVFLNPFQQISVCLSFVNC